MISILMDFIGSLIPTKEPVCLHQRSHTKTLRLKPIVIYLTVFSFWLLVNLWCNLVNTHLNHKCVKKQVCKIKDISPFACSWGKAEYPLQPPRSFGLLSPLQENNNQLSLMLQKPPWSYLPNNSGVCQHQHFCFGVIISVLQASYENDSGIFVSCICIQLYI